MWVSCVNSARLSPLPPMCHMFTAQQERQRWCPLKAARQSSTPSAHTQLFTACHTPAMQCYGVVAGTRTPAVPDLLLWEVHVSRGVISMLSVHWAHSTPQRPPWGGNPRHAWYEGVLARSHGIVFSFAAGGTHWPIAIRCPSLPFPSVKVH